MSPPLDLVLRLNLALSMSAHCMLILNVERSGPKQGVDDIEKWIKDWKKAQMRDARMHIKKRVETERQHPFLNFVKDCAPDSIELTDLEKETVKFNKALSEIEREMQRLLTSFRKAQNEED